MKTVDLSQPFTRGELKQELKQFVTKSDLKTELTIFGEKITAQITEQLSTQLTMQMTAQTIQLTQMTTGLINDLRSEMDMKQAIQLRSVVSELKAHTEEVVGFHSSEVVQTIADIVEPLQKDLKLLVTTI